MKIDIKYGLPFVEVKVYFRGKALYLKHVLLGSAGTITGW